MNNENNKKFVTLDGLRYFLEKIKYELAHNGPANEQSEVTPEDGEDKTE